MRDITPFETELYIAINDQFGHVAWRGTFDSFARIIGHCASDVEPVLKDETFIDVLAQAGTLLWFEKDDVCVVDACRMKFRQPTGSYVCRLCLIDARGEMLPDPDPKSKNGKVHAQCMPRYRRLLQSAQMTEAREHAWK